MRIQILPLPTVVKGDDVEEPFALVVDQCKSGLYSEQDAKEWAGFKEAVGARGILVTPETVEVADRYADDEMTATEEIRNLRDIQGQKGTWNTDEYMRGLYNGLELALSVLEGDRVPVFKSAPGESGDEEQG